MINIVILQSNSLVVSTVLKSTHANILYDSQFTD